MNKNLHRSLLLLVIAYGTTVPAAAQFGRVYLNAPRGSAAMAATYSNTGSNTWIDESIATPQIRSKNNTTNFNYTHVLRVLDRTAGLGINIPVVSHLISWQNTKDGKVLNSDGGFADPSIIFDVNIWGGASMVPEVFRKTPMRDYFGIHTTWGLPLGRYDKNAVSNLGSNRFTSRILLNYGLPFKAGKNWIDLYGSVRFFGKNNAYRGDYSLSQKPLFGLEVHYSHDIAPKTWIGGGLIYGAGGSQRSTIPNDAGVQGQNSIKAAAVFSFPAWKGASTFLSYNRTLVRPAGTPEVSTFILQFLHFVQYKKVKPYKKDPVIAPGL